MLHGYSIINGEPRRGNGKTFTGFDPSTGAALDPAYHYASLEELNLAADLAEEAFATYRKVSGKDKAVFLRHIAAGIESIAADVVERAHRETALGEARLKGELARAGESMHFRRGAVDTAFSNGVFIGLLINTDFPACGNRLQVYLKVGMRHFQGS